MPGVGGQEPVSGGRRWRSLARCPVRAARRGGEAALPPRSAGPLRLGTAGGAGGDGRRPGWVPCGSGAVRGRAGTCPLRGPGRGADAGFPVNEGF